MMHLICSDFNALEEDAKRGGEIVQQIIRHMNKITQTMSKSSCLSLKN